MHFASGLELGVLAFLHSGLELGLLAFLQVGFGLGLGLLGLPQVFGLLLLGFLSQVESSSEDETSEEDESEICLHAGSGLFAFIFWVLHAGSGLGLL